MFKTLKLFSLFCAIPALALPANAASFNFCWVGANGYTLTGTLTFPDAKLNKAFISEDDVTTFRITGYQDGTKIGSWDMATRAPDATWHLRFDPKSQIFPTGGSFASFASQGWNANGTVRDCGNPGFGFNSGSYAQDVCLNGEYIRDSSISPTTPLVATTAAVDPSCGQEIPLSKGK